MDAYPGYESARLFGCGLKLARRLSGGGRAHKSELESNHRGFTAASQHEQNIGMERRGLVGRRGN